MLIDQRLTQSSSERLFQWQMHRDPETHSQALCAETTLAINKALPLEVRKLSVQVEKRF